MNVRRMRLAGIVCALVCSGAAAGEIVPAPLIWRLDAGRIAGCETPPEVLGSPRAVELADVSGLFFDGEDDALLLAVNPLAGAAEFTIEAFVAPEPGGPFEQRFLHIQEPVDRRLLLELRMVAPDRWALDTFLRDGPEQFLTLYDPTRTHPAGRWHWVALRYHDGVMSHFVDGVCEAEGRVAFRAMGDGQTAIGVRVNRVSWFRGAIREVRFHRAALAPEALKRP